MDPEGYSNDDPGFKEDGASTPGVYCSKCRTLIPVFGNLPAAEDARIRELLLESTIRAIRELRNATGCPNTWAKIWTDHPHAWESALSNDHLPCFYCGRPLRSKLAKRCVGCGMDWHDPKSVFAAWQSDSPEPLSQARDRPPAILGASYVIGWARVDGAVRPTGKTRHIIEQVLLDPAWGLVVARSQAPNEGNVTLFYCDPDWQIIADLWQENLSEALKQAEFEYESISRQWRYCPPPGFGT